MESEKKKAGAMSLLPKSTLDCDSMLSLNSISCFMCSKKVQETAIIEQDGKTREKKKSRDVG